MISIWSNPLSHSDSTHYHLFWPADYVNLCEFGFLHWTRHSAFAFRCVMDDDNEVRDRATFYLSVLEQKQKALNAGYILNGNWHTERENWWCEVTEATPESFSVPLTAVYVPWLEWLVACWFLLPTLPALGERRGLCIRRNGLPYERQIL